jgi:hypothetical protein
MGAFPLYFSDPPSLSKERSLALIRADRPAQYPAPAVEHLYIKLYKRGY